MTPEKYLSKRGKLIFERIAEHCKKIGKHSEIFSLEASILANSYDLYHRAVTSITKPEGTYKQVGKTGWETPTVDYSVMNQQLSNINKLSIKFGMNPKDLLAKISEPQDAQTRINKLRKVD